MFNCFDKVSDRIQCQLILNSEAALNFAVSKNSPYLCIICHVDLCVAALSVSHKRLQDRFKEG
jgi:hypothetical protein